MRNTLVHIESVNQGKGTGRTGDWEGVLALNSKCNLSLSPFPTPMLQIDHLERNVRECVSTYAIMYLPPDLDCLEPLIQVLFFRSPERPER